MDSITPQRLSSLSTSTLTLVLELTRSQQFSLAPSASLVPKINRNLSTFRDGINILQQQKQQNQTEVSEEVLSGLRKQYSRLTDLVQGYEGIQVLPLVKLETLIQVDDDEQEDMARTPRASESIPLIPHTSQSIREQEDEEVALQQDDDAMKQANSEVMQLQHRMMSEQDDQLSALSHAISRQRDLSMNISSELEMHSTLLDETDAAIDHTESRLKRAAGTLEKVGRRAGRETSSTCVIIALVAILLVLIVLLK